MGRWLPILIFLAAFGLRLAFSPFGTLENDFNTFIAWSNSLAQNGFSRFYESWSDYLPGYLYVLWLLGKVHQASSLLPQTLLYKLPAILADVATGAVIFFAVSKFSKRWALPAAAIFLFNPAVFANSTLWGQVEGITTFFVLLSVFFSSSNPLIASIALGAGTLIKPQAGFIAPLIFFLWAKKNGFSKTPIYTLPAILIFILGFVPFAGEKQVLSFIFERLSATANQYPYTSVNAFNFWAIVPGVWKPDVGLWQVLGIVIVILVLGILTFRKMNHILIYESLRIYLLSAIYFLITFLFLTRMHERHLLPALAPLVIAAAAFPFLWLSYVALSITYLANLLYSFVWISGDFKQIFPQEVIIFFSFLNVVAAVLSIMVFLKPRFVREALRVLSRVLLPASARSASRMSGSLPPTPPTSASVLIIERHAKKVLVVILGLAFFSRVIFLNFPNTFYFDEVYHAWTAREILHSNTAAWEWWNTPPEGFAYEWSHPPLAKLGMAGGMKIMGENTFAWRLPGALLGTGVVFLVYLLGFQLFKSRAIGLLAAAIFALDGLPLVMSRVGMNDSYFLFFALGAILLFLREKYFWSSVALGFAASSKWTTVWVVPVLFLAMLLFRQKPRWKIFWFALAPVVYLVFYIPFFLSGHDFSKFIELQQQMWWYHTGLEATHTYQSSWWTWPLNIRPVWFFVEYPSVGSGLVSNIYAMGNPLVFWGGFITMGIAAVLGVIRRQAVLIFIFLAWGLMFLPWAFSPRIMFLYHYLPALPFLSLALAWFLSQQNKRVIIAIYLLLSTFYILFFPHWTGIFVPEWLDNLYYWIPSWR